VLPIRLTRTLSSRSRGGSRRAPVSAPEASLCAGANQPLIVVHGTALHHIPDAYRRYLEHFFSDAFQLRGTPLRIQFKVGANPYADVRVRR
jgi:GTP-binding protein